MRYRFFLEQTLIQVNCEFAKWSKIISIKFMHSKNPPDDLTFTFSAFSEYMNFNSVEILHVATVP